MTLIQLQNVSFGYDDASEYLFTDLSLNFGQGWYGLIGANGSGKSTLLKLVTGELAPGSGQVIRKGRIEYVGQDESLFPQPFAELVLYSDSVAVELNRQFKLDYSWIQNWQNLSSGERRRAQLACALWHEPDILILDEPTNHVDAPCREMIIEALVPFKGIGLLVSHDRELLDRLVTNTVLIESGEIQTFHGNYSTVKREVAREKESEKRKLDSIGKQIKKISAEHQRRSSMASHADAKRSKRGIDAKDHDAKSKIDHARLTGKDAVEGKIANRLASRKSQLVDKASDIRIRKEYNIGIHMRGKAKPGNYLFSLDAGGISLNEKRILHFPRLDVKTNDRIAITGANGAGKTTLVNHLLANLRLNRDEIIIMPQEVSQSLAKELVTTWSGLKNEQKGEVMTVVSCLGSRPDALIQSDSPSPGELRKLLLGLGLLKQPCLVVMDEPTNHMDLQSVEALESTLSELECALILISHDIQFLKATTHTNWHLENNSLSISFW